MLNGLHKERECCARVWECPFWVGFGSAGASENPYSGFLAKQYTLVHHRMGIGLD